MLVDRHIMSNYLFYNDNYQINVLCCHHHLAGSGLRATHLVDYTNSGLQL